MRSLVQPVLALLAFSTATLIASDPKPAPPQSRPILLANADIYPVSEPKITRGELLLDKGKIVAVGRSGSVTRPNGCEVIDATGRRIYPAFIAASTTLGLVEVSAVRATADFAEVGSVNPNVRAEVSYNPDSELIPVARSNGIAVVHTVPTGGLISGTSATMMLDSWTWEEATLEAPVGLHIRWPEMGINRSPWVRKSEKEQKEDREKALRSLDEAFDNARAYLVAKEAAGRSGVPAMDTDLRWESMLPFLRRERQVFIHADDIRQIEAAVEWARRRELRMVLVGGRDAWRAVHLLKNANVPVILEAVHSLPERRWEDYDTPFKSASVLADSGVTFCIAASSSPFEAPHQRNLPYQAATAAAFGLPAEEALRSITLYPARILGIDDRMGSLETGKDATLFVTDGDPLEITSRVESLYIQGKRIDLTDKQKRLYEKYQAKYRQMGRLD